MQTCATSAPRYSQTWLSTSQRFIPRSSRLNQDPLELRGSPDTHLQEAASLPWFREFLGIACMRQYTSNLLFLITRTIKYFFSALILKAASEMH